MLRKTLSLLTSISVDNNNITEITLMLSINAEHFYNSQISNSRSIIVGLMSSTIATMYIFFGIDDFIFTSKYHKYEEIMRNLWWTKIFNTILPIFLGYF